MIEGVVLDKRGDRIRSMFATIAPRYDLANRLLSMRQDVGWRKHVSRTLLERPGRVLDLASGTGDLAADLTKAGHEVIAGDFTFEMLHAGRSRYEEHAVTPVTADALRLPFAPESFDAATVAFGVRNFSDPVEGLREIRRSLRPGGVLGVLEFSRPNRLLNLVYTPYMSHVLPMLGGVISGSRAPYEYLRDSVRAFPGGNEFLDVMREAGYGDLTMKPLSGGVATFYRGVN